MQNREVGYQLDRIQRGLEPTDWKPVTSMGQGVREIRIQEQGHYRIIYVARFEDAVYVLHAFHNKEAKNVQAGYQCGQTSVGRGG